MCGLTGLWRSGPGGDPLEEVQRMTATIVHRGPDDDGVWIDAECRLALGFRRLSILDLSPAGHQPMPSASGRHVIVFNGEIYNFRELRAELETLGCTFRGGSDTEVMLAAIETWGLEAATQRFVGMFAFALWDRTDRSLSLVRDRLGKKPLYYAWAGRTFLFGSELKALRAHPDFRAEVDRGALSLFLRHSAVPAPYSIYKDTHQLSPGTILRIAAPDAPRTAPKPYWSLREIAGRTRTAGADAREAADRLDALLRESIQLRMIADVPIGAFLSGGVDSSTVVALMQAQSTRPVRTFTIGFEEDSFDEAAHARAVAAHLHTEHTELVLTADQARAVIPRMPDIYDEPFGDSSQIPTFLVSQLARRQVTVSLSGDGGDELFAGYDRYRITEMIWHKLRLLPHALRRGIAAGLGVFGDRTLLTDRVQRGAALLSTATPQALFHRICSHWKNPADLVIGGFEPPTVFTDPARWPAGCDFAEWMLFIDSVHYLPDDILAKVDRASMALSLETRVPLLDHRVIEYAWSLPMALKRNKRLLRDVLYRYVPKALIERPKMGFSVPIGRWLRGPLRDWAESLIAERRLHDEGFFHPAPIRRKWADHLRGDKNCEYYLWDVLMFQAWLERWG